ncbi:hypothetical protein [Nitrospira sp. Nam74]
MLGSRSNGLASSGTESAPGDDGSELGKPVELRIGEGLTVIAGNETL